MLYTALKTPQQSQSCVEQTTLNADGLHLAKSWEADAQPLITSDSLLGSSSPLPSAELTDDSQDPPCAPVVPYRPPTTESPGPNMLGPSLGQTPVVPETLSLGLWDLDAPMTLGSFPGTLPDFRTLSDWTKTTMTRRQTIMYKASDTSPHTPCSGGSSRGWLGSRTGHDIYVQKILHQKHPGRGAGASTGHLQMTQYFPIGQAHTHRAHVPSSPAMPQQAGRSPGPTCPLSIVQSPNTSCRSQTELASSAWEGEIPM